MQRRQATLIPHLEIRRSRSAVITAGFALMPAEASSHPQSAPEIRAGVEAR